MNRSAYPLGACVVLALAQVAIAAENPGAGPAAAAASPALAESIPLVKTWKPAVFPEHLPADVMSGKATVRLIVDDKGATSGAHVLKATKPEFGDAALTAIKEWTFSPGVDYGKYAAMCIDVPFEFTRGKPQKQTLLPPEHLLPKLAPRTPAALEDGPLGEYPETLVGRGLPGLVLFRCRVNPDGTASGIRIAQASHADFVLPALESSSNWRFTAARQGDLPVAEDLAGEVTYGDVRTPERSKVLEVNGITTADGAQLESAPQPVAMPDPVWPYDPLMKGEAGSASVEFTVTGGGAVTDVKLREATSPAFGAALLAAVETYQFEPAIVRGKGVDVTLVKHADFKPVAAAEDGTWQTRLVHLCRQNAIGTPRGLDAKIVPIYRIAPVRPASAASTTDKVQTVVEFVIDRDGRARLPRIMTPEHEEFGWAAATAISQWIFNPPTRGGKPTEVRVQIPVVF